MRDQYCPSCDRATTRSSELVVALTRAGRALHTALGHRGPVDHCQQPDCLERIRVIQGKR